MSDTQNQNEENQKPQSNKGGLMLFFFIALLLLRIKSEVISRKLEILDLAEN